MAGLRRSEVSFRRQGSSGLVWDDKVVSGELLQLANQQKQENDKNKRPQKNKEEDAATSAAAYSSAAPTGLTIERSRSNGGRGYRKGRVSPALEPPSPKVSACGFCGAFGKSNKTRRRPPMAAKRVR